MRKDLARSISFLFFIAFSGYSLVVALYEVIIGEYAITDLGGNLMSLIFLVVFYLQYRYRFKRIDLVLGCISLAVSLYLVLAIGDDYFDWLRGEDHYNNPRRYFGSGFGIIFTMVAMSSLMIWSDGKVEAEKPV